LAIWLVESSEARIWRHHRCELVAIVDAAMLFDEGLYTVYKMLKHVEIDGIKNIRYDDSHQGNALHI